MTVSDPIEQRSNPDDAMLPSPASLTPSTVNHDSKASFATFAAAFAFGLVFTGFVVIKNATSKAPVPVVLPVTASDVLGKATYRGSAKANYTLVEFTDYQCPPCKVAAATTTQVLSKTPNLKVVSRQLPLDIHPFAKEAALYALASDEQGRFLQVNDELFKAQNLDHTVITEVVRKSGADMRAIEKSVHGSAQQALNRDVALAGRLKLNSTPSFLLCRPDGTVVKVRSIGEAALLASK